MSRVGHKCRESGEITSEILKKPEFAGIFRGKKIPPTKSPFGGDKMAGLGYPKKWRFGSSTIVGATT